KQALGAQERRIKREFMMVGIKQLLWGGIPGLIAGSAMGFAMAQVFGLESAAIAGIATFMVTVIGAVVILATYFPTKRALEMEPSAALRYE
ncbi:MAG: ABC transporter permease, partial [Kordiimonas sp.]